METKKWYHLLWCFVRQYRMSALMFALFSVIFAVIFSLYDLETEAVFYAAGLCILAAVVILGVRFRYYCREYYERRYILSAIESEFQRMPDAKTLPEEDYQQMIRTLGKINNSHQTQWQQERQESIDYYTAWVHQIKTPIAVMRMNLQSEDTGEHRELLTELFRIEQYVEMVLSYVRLGSNQTDFVIKEYELDSIIRQAVRKYAPQFVRKRIRLIYEPVNIKVLTDEKWLLFILEQIISNAIKYTQQGTVTVAVSQEQVLSVSDTGIGIASEDLPRIFEKGFTGYNGRADKKATGLGLYLCMQTALKLGITLTAESEAGKGSTFFLDLHKESLILD
jgi:hypothetical protein